MCGRTVAADVALRDLIARMCRRAPGGQWFEPVWPEGGDESILIPRMLVPPEMRRIVRGPP